jgi:hypothetical protein
MSAAAAGRSKSCAIVTASYLPDLDRCRLLCDTIDARVTGHEHHYILVAAHDVAAFRALEGPRRTVVDERDLLPSWLLSFPDPLSGFRRRIWLSARTMPLRGWHVQQLRRIAIAGHVTQDALLYCDSDVAFVRPFDCGSLWRGDALRLFRRDGVLETPGHETQRLWSRNAGRALGLPDDETSPHDYIATVIAWRRDAAVAMCERIEAVHGRNWVAAVASTRHFSECMLHGRFVDEVLRAEGHFHDGHELCRIYWNGPALTDETLREFVSAMTPDQVAIGMQSFIGTDVGSIRRLLAA